MVELKERLEKYENRTMEAGLPKDIDTIVKDMKNILDEYLEDKDMEERVKMLKEIVADYERQQTEDGIIDFAECGCAIMKCADDLKKFMEKADDYNDFMDTVKFIRNCYPDKVADWFSPTFETLAFHESCDKITNIDDILDTILIEALDLVYKCNAFMKYRKSVWR